MRCLVAVAMLIACNAPAPVADQPAAPAAVVAPSPLAVGPSGGHPDPNSVQVPPAGACHTVNGLPDPVCTPGAANPGMTTATLCTAGFSTKTIRPPVSYTDALKKRLMVSYGLTGAPADFELDHLVALEDGGHPWDVRNLWPEPRQGTPNAGEKDRIENASHKAICSGALDLDTARLQMARDWTKLNHTTALLAVDEPTPEPSP